MAGEVQGFSSLQADCLPTGSISFGRFEFESLSWQRRSSFAYNRHLEDVERYATPGLVTQKKTYFEDQFKKRALLRQSSSKCQNGNYSGNKGNDTTEHMEYMEEQHNAERQQHLALSDEALDIMDSYEFDTIKRNREEFKCLLYAETSAVSHEQQHNVTERRQEEKTSPFECPVELKPLNNKKLSHSSGTLVDHNVAVQTQSGCVVLQSNTNSMHTGIEHKPESEAETMDRLLGKRDPSCKSPINEKDNTPSLKKMQRASLKVKTTVEQKPAKPNARTAAPVPKINRKISTEREILSSGRASSKTSRKMEGENTFLRKSERLLPSTVLASTFSNSKNLKSENFGKQKTQLKQENGSVKGQRTNKAGFTASLITERSRKAVTSVKVDGKQIGATNNFRSDQRAEKRKDIITYDSRTQDKVEEVNSHAKSLRLRSKCPSPMNRTMHHENPPAFTKRTNRNGPSSQSTSSNLVGGPTSSAGQTGCSVGSHGRIKTGFQDNNHTLQSGKKTEAEKDLRSKWTTLQRQGAEGMKKSERVGTSRRVGEIVSTVRKGNVQKVISGVSGSMPVRVTS